MWQKGVNMIVKLRVTNATHATSKDGKDLYFVKCRDDVYAEELKKYIGGVSFFTNEETYQRILDGDDTLVLHFTGKQNVIAE